MATAAMTTCGVSRGMISLRMRGNGGRGERLPSGPLRPGLQRVFPTPLVGLLTGLKEIASAAVHCSRPAV